MFTTRDLFAATRRLRGDRSSIETLAKQEPSTMLLEGLVSKHKALSRRALPSLGKNEESKISGHDVGQDAHRW
jgi:hypothetical protein